MGRKKVEEEDGGNGFTVLFTALSIILLAFFIVLNSIAVIAEPKRMQALGSLVGTFGPPKGKAKFNFLQFNTPPTEIESQVKEQIKKLNEKYLPRLLHELAKMDALERAMVAVYGANIEINLDSRLLFEAGQADLSPNAHNLLDSIIEKAREEGYPVVIEGYTDDRPISSARFDNNWELSVMRATAVLDYMHEAGKLPKKQLAAFGYGSNRPVAPNDSPENRALNRRVRIVLVGAGAMSKAKGIKRWWKRIGIVNPFEALDGE